MRWRRGRRSGDIVDRRGARSRGVGTAGAVGLPVVIIIVLARLFLGGGTEGDEIDDVFGDLAPPGGTEAAPLPSEADPDRKLVDFLSFVLDDVQGFWVDTFEASDRTYRRAELVLFTGATGSGCGSATSDIGPHYCPLDEKVYIDLEFFRELRSRFGAPGDFAQAYVLAHEIAHHVQNVLGVNEQVRDQQQSDPDRANDLSIRLELQADCLAGVWGYTTAERRILEPGDLEEGLEAAAAVGDDRIQEQATGTIDRESWTHGSSEQRVRWFTRGFETGDPQECDTFSRATV